MLFPWQGWPGGKQRGLVGDTDRGMRNMAAWAKRLHLFIVSARGRRQNVCPLRARAYVYLHLCARAKPRKNKTEREKERDGDGEILAGAE